MANILTDLFFEIEFMDGIRAEIDGRRVLQYTLKGNGIYEDGLGADYEYLVNSISAGKAIILYKGSMARGTSEKERIINTDNIRTIIPVSIKESELYTKKRSLNHSPPYRTLE